MAFAGTPKNWPLTSYSTSTWTDLIATTSGEKIVRGIQIGTGSNAGTVKVRVTDSASASLYTVVPGESLLANTSYPADFQGGMIMLNSTEKLQVWASVSGFEFSAHGFI